MEKKRVKKLIEEVKLFANLEEATSAFLKFKMAQGISELTLRDYNNTFARFKKGATGSISLLHLKSDILTFLTPLTDASPAKFNRPYSNMNSLFNWLVEQEVLEKNPITSLGLKKKRDEGRIRCIEVEKIQILLESMDIKTFTGLRDYTLALLMLDCGIRPCEAFKLKTDDVNAKNSTLNIQKQNSKTRTGRILPLSDTMIQLFHRLNAVTPKNWNSMLIFNSCDGNPMHIEMFDKRLQYYSEKGHIKVTPYDLRHTFATMYLRNDGNVFSLQRTMGHSSLNMTKRYLSLSMDDMIQQHRKASPLQNIVKRNTRVSKLFK